MVKIRLMRIGSKKRPFYRIVAVDEREKRDGRYLALLGTYNPLTKPKEVIIDQKLVDAWIKKGAVASDGFLRITGQAPQRPPRKPKKTRSKTAPASAPAEAPTSQTDETAGNEPITKEQLTEVNPTASPEQTPEDTTPEVQAKEGGEDESGTTEKPQPDVNGQ